MVCQFPEQLGADTQTPVQMGLCCQTQHWWEGTHFSIRNRIWALGRAQLNFHLCHKLPWAALLSLKCSGLVLCFHKVPSQMGFWVFGGTEHRAYWSPVDTIKLSLWNAVCSIHVACWVVKLQSHVVGESSENLWLNMYGGFEVLFKLLIMLLL